MVYFQLPFATDLRQLILPHFGIGLGIGKNESPLSQCYRSWVWTTPLTAVHFSLYVKGLAIALLRPRGGGTIYVPISTKGSGPPTTIPQTGSPV